MKPQRGGRSRPPLCILTGKERINDESIPAPPRPLVLHGCGDALLPDRSGFRFERLDDLCDEIVFFVAWIETRIEIENETEDAVQFWTL